MEEIEIVSSSETELKVRHIGTGHEFTYLVDAQATELGNELRPGPVREGHGPLMPGDVAADARAFAKREAARLGLL